MKLTFRLFFGTVKGEEFLEMRSLLKNDLAVNHLSGLLKFFGAKL